MPCTVVECASVSRRLTSDDLENCLSQACWGRPGAGNIAVTMNSKIRRFAMLPYRRQGCVLIASGMWERAVPSPSWPIVDSHSTMCIRALAKT